MRLVAVDIYAHALIAPTSYPWVLPQLFYTETTHLFPGPQSIVLLELALVVWHTVLAENPAGTCQYRARCGKP
jgi:hypothetical protein